MRCARLNAPAVSQIVRNAGGAEGVTAYCGFDAGVRSAAAHHVPDIGAQYRSPSEFLSLTVT